MKQQIKKPPLRVASVVSILIISGQDTIRLDEKNSEVPKQELDFNVHKGWGFHPLYPFPHMTDCPIFSFTPSSSLI